MYLIRWQWSDVNVAIHYNAVVNLNLITEALVANVIDRKIKARAPKIFSCKSIFTSIVTAGRSVHCRFWLRRICPGLDENVNTVFKTAESRQDDDDDGWRISHAIASKPVNPNQSKPVKPPHSKPVNPNQSKPVKPPHSKPVNPNQCKPVKPPHSKPVNPNRSKTCKASSF
jgi:type IV secretory pathway VirB10-like protein